MNAPITISSFEAAGNFVIWTKLLQIPQIRWACQWQSQRSSLALRSERCFFPIHQSSLVSPCSPELTHRCRVISHHNSYTLSKLAMMLSSAKPAARKQGQVAMLCLNSSRSQKMMP